MLRKQQGMTTTLRYEEDMRPKTFESSLENTKKGKSGDSVEFKDKSTTAVPDELEARAPALDTNTSEQNSLEKCMEIIRSQGQEKQELISQVRVMFTEYIRLNKEYKRANAEREYYENLSLNLFSYIEILNDNERRTMEEDSDEEEEEEDVANLVNSDRIPKIIIHEEIAPDANTATQTASSKTKPSDGHGEMGCSSETKVDKNKSSKIRRNQLFSTINEMLRRERLNFRYHLLRNQGSATNSQSETEFATSDDDDDDDESHACEHCLNTKMANARIQDNTSQTTEEYTSQEDTPQKIPDESDSD